MSDHDEEPVWIFTLHHDRFEPSQYAANLPWLMSFPDAVYQPTGSGYTPALRSGPGPYAGLGARPAATQSGGLQSRGAN